MTRLLPLVLLAGCVGMTARNLPETTQAAPADVGPNFSPQSSEPVSPDLDIPDEWTSAGETWRFDIRLNNGVASAALGKLDRELAMEIVIDDPPTLGVRLAYVVADTAPALQDFCGATLTPPLGDLQNNVFSIDVSESIQLGQPWVWQHVTLTGRMDRETGALSHGLWRGVVDAIAVAAALDLGEAAPCDGLASLGLQCVPCVQDVAQSCVVLELPLSGERANDFILEPMNEADAAANDTCSPEVGPI